MREFNLANSQKQTMKPECLPANDRILIESGCALTCDTVPVLFRRLPCSSLPRRGVSQVYVLRCEKLPIANEKSAFEKDATVRRR